MDCHAAVERNHAAYWTKNIEIGMHGYEELKKLSYLDHAGKFYKKMR